MNELLTDCLVTILTMLPNTEKYRCRLVKRSWNVLLYETVCWDSCLVPFYISTEGKIMIITSIKNIRFLLPLYVINPSDKGRELDGAIPTILYHSKLPALTDHNIVTYSLDDAAKKGDVDMVKSLLSDKITIPQITECCTDRKKTRIIIMLLISHPRFSFKKIGCNTMLWSINNNYPTIFKKLLLHKETIKFETYIALVTAIKQKNIQMIDIILKHTDEDPSFDDNRHIINAAANGNLKILKLLLNDPRTDLFAQNLAAVKIAASYDHASILHFIFSLKQLRISDWCSVRGWAIGRCYRMICNKIARGEV